jgi:hypothetical protein
MTANRRDEQDIDAYEAAYDRLGGLPRLQSRAVSVRWLSARTAEVTVLPPGLARNRRARERWAGMTPQERWERRFVRTLGENTLRAVNADRAARGLPPEALRRAP